MSDNRSIHDKIRAGEYQTKWKFVRRRDDPEAFAAYQADIARLDKQFRVDLFAELGITNNPKRDLLFEKAWDMGHASGYEEVANYALDLVELIE